MLQMLGISVPAWMVGLASSELPEVISLHQRSGLGTAFASDHAYLTILDGKLAAVPVNGEAFNFLWDLSRHVYRAITIGYRAGDHRKPRERAFLKDIFCRLQFDELRGALQSDPRPLFLDEVVLLQRSNAVDCDLATRRHIYSEDAAAGLSTAIQCSAHHKSRYWSYWREHPEELNQKSTQLAAITAEAGSCAVSCLSLGCSKPHVPDHIYSHAADLLVCPSSNFDECNAEVASRFAVA